MTIKELKKLLEGLNEDNEVLLATDEEGNGFGTIASDFGEHTYEDGENGLKNVYALYPEYYINPQDIR